ncbi:MAG TPA: hypothetical protein VF594_03500, partial [Rubricoccaceae bacterium]
MLRLALVSLLLTAVLPGSITRDTSEGEAAADLAEYADRGEIRRAERAAVAYIVLTDVPFTPPSGTRAWDLASGPDLEVDLQTSRGASAARSRGSVADDVGTDSLPVWLSVEADARAVRETYVLTVSDWDATGSDHMFRTEPFSAEPARRAGR